MDIFDAPKRTKNQALKRPINFPQGDVTQKKLQQDNKHQMEQFNRFLNNIYMKFDYKINNCKYRCISKANSYAQIGDCLQKCGEGATKFGTYIDSRVTEMQQLLGECVSNASLLPNTMDQIYYCYQLYNKGYKKLKQFIVQQSMFYQ